MNSPEALLLDLDGTLVDTEPLHRAAYAEFFAARGWDPPEPGVFTGRRAEDVFATEPGPWTGSDPRALSAEVMALVPADQSPPRVAGADALIEAAVSRRIPIAIVTSAGPPWVDTCIGALLGHVRVVVTSNDVVDGKPHPAGYLLAVERLGVPADRALAVEDSPAGVAAARAARIGEVVGVSTTHPAELLLEAGAAAVHPDLSALAHRLRAPELP